MPPKIASLVKYFEERQQQDGFSDRPSSSIHSPSPSSRRSVSGSSVQPTQALSASPGRDSAPAVRQVLSTPSRAHLGAGHNGYPRAGTAIHAAGSTSGSQDTKNMPVGDYTSTPTPNTGSPVFSQPPLIKGKAPPANPIESQDQATNVDGRKAGQMLIDMLVSTSSPPKEKGAGNSSPGGEANVDTHAPVPIKDRFKHRHPLLARPSVFIPSTSVSLPIPAETLEMQSRKTSLPVYPGSVTSLTTLVEEASIPPDPINERTVERLPLYSRSEQTMSADAKVDGKFDIHEYLDRSNASFSSFRTKASQSSELGNFKDIENFEDTCTSSPAHPALPTSNSSGGMSALTADIPAFNVFSAGSKPLKLPLLDEYIENIPVVNFSQPEKVMSDKELASRHEWIAQAGDDQLQRNLSQKQRIWNKWVGVLKPKSSECSTTSSLDVDQREGCKIPTTFKNRLNAEQAKKALIFPPMQLLPPNLTVTDLKNNRSKKAPPISLNVMLSTAIDAVLGAEGSTYGVSLIRVEAFRDLIQILGSVTDFAKPHTSSSSMSTLHSNSTSIADHIRPLVNATTVPLDRTSPRYVILTVVPSIVGLDFVSAFGKAVLWLWVFTILCFIGCYEFRVMAREVGSAGSRKGGRVGHGVAGHFSEGLDCEEAYNGREIPTYTGRIPGIRWFSKLRRSRGYRIVVIFLITSLYLPLSKISIGALAWTSDFWAVENYYAYEDNPSPIPLGTKEQFHDPLNFCYKTTMRKQGWNWSIPILMISSITILVITIWFPIKLWFIVKSQVPRVDSFTELGEKRKDSGSEYKRLLERDQSPFNFIYNEYRKPWSGFESAYMALKLINVLCITLLTKDNCIFRFRHRAALDVIRQSTILGFMICWMALQIWAKPFNDRYQNNSDWCSRTAYVLIAILGLAAALRLPGKAAYSGWLLVTFTAVSYIFNAYFAIIGTVYAQRLIQRWQKRLDFSIDIFSPHLDTAKHIIRRIQQETLSTLLLAAPEYKVRRKPDEALVFCNLSEAAKLPEDGQSAPPPYLLGFSGSQGERHLENLKILREIGLARYVAAVELSRDPSRRLSQLQAIIMDRFTGPDCVWWSEALPQNHFIEAGYFGRATILPFPFTLIFRYDQGEHVAVLTTEKDFEAYLAQNESPEAVSGRRIRLALRALEGCRCYFPYVADLSTTRGLRPTKSRMFLDCQVRYNYGLLRIDRNLDYSWRGYNYNSGFTVRLEYRDGRYLKADGTYKNGIFLSLDGEKIGIARNFALSNTLARFLQLNRHIIEQNMPKIEARLAAHREFFREEIEEKRQTLSYAFLIDVYANEHFDRTSLSAALAREPDEATRAMLDDHASTFCFLQERMQAANRDTVCQWWYLLWDDISRRNCSSIAQLQKYETDFSPKYRSSICYRPLARQGLETFLSERGLWIEEGTKGFFTHGILNRIYFYMDEMLFAGTKAGIPLKVGRHRHPVRFHELGTLRAHDPEDSFGQDTKHTYDTGQGTDHDEGFYRNRPAFLFEEMYERRYAAYGNHTTAKIVRLRDRISRRVQTWFGIRPFEVAMTAPSLYFSLREDQGTYSMPRARRAS